MRAALRRETFDKSQEHLYRGKASNFTKPQPSPIPIPPFGHAYVNLYEVMRGGSKHEGLPNLKTNIDQTAVSDGFQRLMKRP